MVRVLIAPDSFKGTMTAEQAARAMANGVRRVEKQIEVVLMPMADGGEGTIQVLHSRLGGKLHMHSVFNPFAALVQAPTLHLSDGTVVVEMAAASGLGLIPKSRHNNRSALRASTFGTGELVRAALEGGAKQIVLTLGGSATTDGGFGLLQALGAVYYDTAGVVLDGRDSGHLASIAEIDVKGVHPKFFTTPFILATDVTNPLCGADGAAVVYGPQKGLSATGVSQRDMELARFARLVCQAFAVSEEIAARSGAGAAGGIGLPFLAQENTRLESGATFVGTAIGFEQELLRCDWVMTGEGKTDGQSVAGKVPAYVAQMSSRHEKPCVVVSGALGSGCEELFHLGVTHMIAASPEDADESTLRQHALGYVQQAAFHVAADMVKSR